MRIALAVEGTRGDVHPMLALGDRLRARGHEIVVCAPPDFQADAEAHGFVFHPVGVAARETLTVEADAVVRGGLRMLRAANRYVESSLRAQFAALPAATSGADLIVGAGVQMAAASVAERARRALPLRRLRSHHASPPASTRPSCCPCRGFRAGETASCGGCSSASTA